MTPLRSSVRFLTAGALLAVTVLPSCGGSSVSPGTRSAGAFEVLSTTMSDNDVWALNRPIDFVFNHPVDTSTIGFNSIIIKPVSQEILSQPVTGSFSVVSGTGGKVIRFTPACPTNITFSNGGFIPGGFDYTLTLPSNANQGGLSLLQDDQGRTLSVGLTRNFTTPFIGEPLFIDTVLGPPQLVARLADDWPSGLNLFTRPDPSFVVRVNQPVESSDSNLNNDNIFILYSEADGVTFTGTNKLPGEWLLIDNCNLTGATLRFEVSGILPPGRKLRMQLTPDFADLSGETNTTTLTYLDNFGAPLDYQLPTLGEFYGDGSDWTASVTYDEFSEDFETDLGLDLAAELFLPPMKVSRGHVEASFDFPLTSIDPQDNFVVRSGIFLMVDTTGTTTVTDSNGRQFTVVDGVLEVRDLTVEAGGTLKAEGVNPLVIYAAGAVDVQGTLDASGDHAKSPQRDNDPGQVVPGAFGQCGGGSGGTASWVTNAETLRGEDGFGPFGVPAGGGGGGEGGFQQDLGVLNANETASAEFLVAAGAGGGGFAPGVNESVQWAKWSGAENLFFFINGQMTQFDNSGPDTRYQTRHTALDIFTDNDFAGAETGLRGTSWNSGNTALHEGQLAPPPSAAYGMEDGTRDTGPIDGPFGGQSRLYDPIWTSGNRRYKKGQPTNGPDQGRGGSTLFSDEFTDNDFWGARINPDGSVTQGELTGPMAGSGGGASGDMSIIERPIIGFDPMTGAPLYGPLTDNYPDPEFPNGTTLAYYKGAPGGGGGGQMMIFAVGTITIGNDAQLKVNGGNGAGGEAVFRDDNQVSGSGGGSGGHMVLHTATGLDLTAIDLGLGPGATIGQIKAPNNRHEVALALGGRRGWSMTGLTTNGGIVENDNRTDGNSDYMVGRGGAGGNGLIQIHVPNPLTDIAFHPNLVPAIDSDAPGGIREGLDSGVFRYANNDNLEEIMRAFCVPQPMVLIPVFATGSMLQSRWHDTGTALNRNPLGDVDGKFLSFVDAQLAMDGFITGNADLELNGRLNITGDTVDVLPPVASGTTHLSVGSFSALMSSASLHFAANPQFLTNPKLLVGYDLLPSALGRPTESFEIVDASYDGNGLMTLTTAASDGAMSPAPGATWYIRPKFVRLDTAAVKDSITTGGFFRAEFQGADGSTDGNNTITNPGSWTTDLADLADRRFFRYRITLEMAESGSFSISNPRPQLRYLKIPFAW